MKWPSYIQTGLEWQGKPVYIEEGGAICVEESGTYLVEVTNSDQRLCIARLIAQHRERTADSGRVEATSK